MRFNTAWLVAASLFGATLLPGCGADYVPKQRGYHRLELPAHAYRALADTFPRLPYTFKYSAAAKATLAKDRLAEPYWIDLAYPQFGATVQLTYKPVAHDLNRLNTLLEDGRKLANKHQVRASGIDERRVHAGPGGTAGWATLFKLRGQVPSQYQFYVTDSSAHYLRGALYFNTSERNDSLAPIIGYIGQDLDTLLATLVWKNAAKK